jgi:hypothetical protein
MFGLRSRVRSRDSAMSADTRTNEELLDTACNGNESALAGREQAVGRQCQRRPRNYGLDQRKDSA